MATLFEGEIRAQLTNRRQSPEKVISISPNDSYLYLLLKEMDAALSRIDSGAFGICETFHESIESERFVADPLIRLCLDRLTPSQQRTLAQSLELAARIQWQSSIMGNIEICSAGHLPSIAQQHSVNSASELVKLSVKAAANDTEHAGGMRGS